VHARRLLPRRRAIPVVVLGDRSPRAGSWSRAPSPDPAPQVPRCPAQVGGQRLHRRRGRGGARAYRGTHAIFQDHLRSLKWAGFAARAGPPWALLRPRGLGRATALRPFRQISCTLKLRYRAVAKGLRQRFKFPPRRSSRHLVDRVCGDHAALGLIPYSRHVALGRQKFSEAATLCLCSRTVNEATTKTRWRSGTPVEVSQKVTTRSFVATATLAYLPAR